MLFFRELTTNAPLLVRKAATRLANEQRLSGLRAMINSYVPSVKVSFVQSELGFESIAECIEYLKQFDGIQYGTGSETKPEPSATSREMIITKPSKSFSLKKEN
mmetsp:Transcript_2711/g.4391  ORF Transcript_2711/g.4391 Transcript_2711/m.4391 type:complete len:104 (-) Transcript_2711:30-341(-)